VSNEADLERVERMLQRTPAPEAVPAAAAIAARNAALGAPAPVVRVSRTRRWKAWWPVASGAALGATAAAALVLALTSGGGGFATQFSVALHGPQGATAEVAFSGPHDGVRKMRVTTTGLPPAHAGQYYEMWFRTPGGENVSAVTFNTPDAGKSSFTAVIPAGMTWHRCWVTLENVDGSAKRQMILTT
jgi:Anti-sigma-K factor rskA